MALVWANCVADTTTTTGTGVITVSGTSSILTGQTFSAVCSTSDTFYGRIAHQTLNEWEEGLYTYSGTNQITRTTVINSSNSNSAVSFSAGTKDVTLVLPASVIATMVATGQVWTSVSYSTTIPLDGIKYMPRQTVAASITFTAGTTVAGGQCYLRLIADGSHAPTFSGMTESAMSSGYNNTNTVDNQITFWYDGITVWYAVQQ